MTLRVRLYQLPFFFLEGLLAAGERHFMVDESWPEGARIVAAFYDPQEQRLLVKVVHESFDPVSEGDVIPIENARLTRL